MVLGARELTHACRGSVGGVGLGTTGMRRCLSVWGPWVPRCSTGLRAVQHLGPWDCKLGGIRILHRGQQRASMPLPGCADHPERWARSWALSKRPKAPCWAGHPVPFPPGRSPAYRSAALIEVHEPPGTWLLQVQHLAVQRAGGSQAVLPDAHTLSSWFSASHVPSSVGSEHPRKHQGETGARFFPGLPPSSPTLSQLSTHSSPSTPVPAPASSWHVRKASLQPTHLHQAYWLDQPNSDMNVSWEAPEITH